MYGRNFILKSYYHSVQFQMAVTIILSGKLGGLAVKFVREGPGTVLLFM